MTEFIKLIAEATWKETDKTIGRVTLGESIEVGMEADELVTKVVRRFRIPVLPDVAFTYTSRERFSLTVPGSEPPLQTSFREDLDVGTGALGLAFIVGLLSPILGGIVFFAADPIAESRVPDVQRVGEGLASAWPSQIMTGINPPFLPGKFVLIWTDLSDRLHSLLGERTGVLG